MPSFFNWLKSHSKYENWDTQKIQNQIKKYKISIDLLNEELNKSSELALFRPFESTLIYSMEFFSFNRKISQIQKKIEKLSIILSKRNNSHALKHEC